MTKRNDGEGTLVKRKDKNGKVTGWKGAVTVGFRLDGAPDRRWVSGKTPDAVRERMEAIKTARNTGMISDGENISLAEYLARWIAYKQVDGTRVKTVSRYAQTVTKRLIPTLGKIRLEKLRPLDVEVALRTIREGVTVKEARRARTVLSMSLNQAMRWEMIPRNVYQAVKLPSLPPGEDKEIRFWRPDEAARYLETARKHRHYALFYVGLMTGMRPCELLGLRWQDVDFAEGMIRVEQDAVDVQGKMFVGPVKTRASRRTITISPDTVVVLREHQVRQALEREGAAEGYHEHNLVFASEAGTVTGYNNLRRVFRALTERAGVSRMGLHGLRHTHASILISLDVNPKVVADRLGHTSVAFTLKQYTHLFDGQRREAAIGIADFLGTNTATPARQPAN